MIPLVYQELSCLDYYCNLSERDNFIHHWIFLLAESMEIKKRITDQATCGSLTIFRERNFVDYKLLKDWEKKCNAR